MVDGELEEDNAHVSRASLTQHFPFDACPPTTKQASHSPCLQRLIEAVMLSKDSMTVAERNSLIKVCCSSSVLVALSVRVVWPGVELKLKCPLDVLLCAWHVSRITLAHVYFSTRADAVNMYFAVYCIRSSLCSLNKGCKILRGHCMSANLDVVQNACCGASTQY